MRFWPAVMFAALYFASLVENLFETRLSAVARQEKFRNLAYNYVSPQAKSLLVILWPIGCCQDFYRSIAQTCRDVETFC